MGTGQIKDRAGGRTAEARLLALADRLFRQFDELPVRTVLQAIGAARLELRERNEGIASPEDIELLARRRLEAVPPDATSGR